MGWVEPWWPTLALTGVRIEVTDNVPPFLKPCAVGCFLYILVSILAVIAMGAMHRARQKAIAAEARGWSPYPTASKPTHIDGMVDEFASLEE